MNVVQLTPLKVTIELNLTELTILQQVLNEICNGISIEDWEFPIRLGVERTEAQRLQSALKDIQLSKGEGETDTAR